MNEEIESLGGRLTEIDHSRDTQRRIGSMVLMATHYYDSKVFKESLESTQQKDGNPQHRIEDYLNLIEKNPHVLKKQWTEAIDNGLLVKYENIPEVFWNRVEEDPANNSDAFESSDDFRDAYYISILKQQKESLVRLIDYLCDDTSPYPDWFKSFALHGMTRMGSYDKRRNRYNRRNKTTVAPYPEPNAEILSKIYEDILNYYTSTKETKNEVGINLRKVFGVDSFADIYNIVRQDIAPVVEPPERPEDVQGRWIEYEVGDERIIATVTDGTGWCIASSVVAKNYLLSGKYGYKNDGVKQSRAKFLLFHLIDSKTGKLSKNAVASIRLGLEGEVAEVSGLGKGQSLSDSLVPTVEMEVGSLPGGEKFIPAFEDKKELIRLDHKLQDGEPLTKRELGFVYEIDRPIETLDTYNKRDPRIEKLRDKYDVEYALNAGLDPEQLINTFDQVTIIENLKVLTEHRMDINDLVPRLSSYFIARHLDSLLDEYRADVNKLKNYLTLHHTAEKVDVLIRHGAEIDIAKLVSELDSKSIAECLDALTAPETNISLNELIARMSPDAIVDNLNLLTRRNADINLDGLASKLSPGCAARNLFRLLDMGVDPNELIKSLNPEYAAHHMDRLIECGLKNN